MTDVLNPQQRSYCMSQIRGKDTKPEIVFRKALWREGFRYSLKYKLYGKPDIILPGRKIAVFIDGCFWHGWPLHYNKPNTNKKFWKEKIKKNIERDKQVNRYLKKNGWQVVRYWEHQVKNSLAVCIKNFTKKCK